MASIRGPNRAIWRVVKSRLSIRRSRVWSGGSSASRLPSRRETTVPGSAGAALLKRAGSESTARMSA
jgi:hypothetical protein